MAKAKGYYRDAHGRVVIQVYNPAAKKPRKIPREECAHLDSADDAAIEQWRALYIQENRHKARHTMERFLSSTDEAQFLFTAFLSEHRKLRHTSTSSRRDQPKAASESSQMTAAFPCGYGSRMRSPESVPTPRRTGVAWH